MLHCQLFRLIIWWWNFIIFNFLCSPSAIIFSQWLSLTLLDFNENIFSTWLISCIRCFCWKLSCSSRSNSIWFSCLTHWNSSWCKRSFWFGHFGFNHTINKLRKFTFIVIINCIRWNWWCLWVVEPFHRSMRINTSIEKFFYLFIYSFWCNSFRTEISNLHSYYYYFSFDYLNIL